MYSGTSLDSTYSGHTKTSVNIRTSGETKCKLSHNIPPKCGNLSKQDFFSLYLAGTLTQFSVKHLCKELGHLLIRTHFKTSHLSPLV